MRARARPRKDGNHSEIADRFQAWGASVLDLSPLPGALDLLVGYLGVDWRVEVKDGAKAPSRRELTKLEQRAIDQWEGRPPVVIESIDDVDRMMRQLNREHASRGRNRNRLGS